MAVIYYKVAPVVNGVEGVLSNEISIDDSAEATACVFLYFGHTINFTTIPEATAYRIYRSIGTSGAQNEYVETLETDGSVNVTSPESDFGDTDNWISGTPSNPASTPYYPSDIIGSNTGLTAYTSGRDIDIISNDLWLAKSKILISHIEPNGSTPAIFAASGVGVSLFTIAQEDESVLSNIYFKATNTYIGDTSDDASLHIQTAPSATNPFIKYILNTSSANATYQEFNDDGTSIFRICNDPTFNIDAGAGDSSNYYVTGMIDGLADTGDIYRWTKSSTYANQGHGYGTREKFIINHLNILPWNVQIPGDPTPRCTITYDQNACYITKGDANIYLLCPITMPRGGRFKTIRIRGEYTNAGSGSSSGISVNLLRRSLSFSSSTIATLDISVGATTTAIFNATSSSDIDHDYQLSYNYYLYIETEFGGVDITNMEIYGIELEIELDRHYPSWQF